MFPLCQRQPSVAQPGHEACLPTTFPSLLVSQIIHTSVARGCAEEDFLVACRVWRYSGDKRVSPQLCHSHCSAGAVPTSLSHNVSQMIYIGVSCPAGPLIRFFLTRGHSPAAILDGSRRSRALSSRQARARGGRDSARKYTRST